jgi:hypothetical protein
MNSNISFIGQLCVLYVSWGHSARSYSPTLPTYRSSGQRAPILASFTCRAIPYLEVGPQSLLAASVVVPTSTRLFLQDLGLDSTSASILGCDFQVCGLSI